MMNMGCASFFQNTYMAPNVKKEKQFPRNKEASAAVQWPDLPQQFLYSITRQKPMARNIGWGGVSKTWRTARRHCSSTAGKAPWLQLSCDRTSNQHQIQDQVYIMNVPFRQGFYLGLRRRGGLYTNFHFAGCSCSHGHIYTNTSYMLPNNDFLNYLIQGWGIYIPPWDTKTPFKFATFSGNTGDGNPSGWTTMVVTGVSKPAFVFYRGGWQAAWIKQDCTLLEPNAPDKQPMTFTNAIGFKDKFYALRLQGTLAVLEEVDSIFDITEFSKYMAVPSVPSRHFLEYLIESSGEILSVFLISRKSSNIVDDVEVFRLHLAKLAWEKMDNLGDRALLLGTNCCMSVTASRVGCKSNCVYFTHQAIDSWLEYDMVTGTISPC